MSKKNEKIIAIDKIIGKNIRRIRRNNDLTMEGLGKYIGVVSQQIQKYEKGINSISFGKIVFLSKIFGVEIEEFYKGLDLSDTIFPINLSRKHLSTSYFKESKM